MKQFLLMIFASCIACSIVAAQAEKSSRSGERGAVVALEHEWAKAEQNADREALDRIVASDYKFTDLNGKSGTKSEYLANLHKSSAAPGPESANDYDVQVYSTVAVVTHTATFDGRGVDGEAVKAKGLDVWVKEGKAWKVVAHQWTEISGPRGDALPKEFLARCAQMSFQPEIHSFYGSAAVILPKLENDTMGLPDRRGYLLLIETAGSAELAFFERASTQDSRVLHWEGKSAAELREKLTDYIMANRGIACVGAQTKAIIKASLNLSDLGRIPTPLSASAAFSHLIRKYGDDYLRVTAMLLC